MDCRRVSSAALVRVVLPVLRLIFLKIAILLKICLLVADLKIGRTRTESEERMGSVRQRAERRSVIYQPDAATTRRPLQDLSCALTSTGHLLQVLKSTFSPHITRIACLGFSTRSRQNDAVDSAQTRCMLDLRYALQ